MIDLALSEILVTRRSTKSLKLGEALRGRAIVRPLLGQLCLNRHSNAELQRSATFSKLGCNFRRVGCKRLQTFGPLKNLRGRVLAAPVRVHWRRSFGTTGREHGDLR